MKMDHRMMQTKASYVGKKAWTQATWYATEVLPVLVQNCNVYEHVFLAQYPD